MDNWPKKPQYGDQYMDVWAQNWFWDGELWVSSDAAYIIDTRTQKSVSNVRKHLHLRRQELLLSSWELRLKRMQEDTVNG